MRLQKKVVSLLLVLTLFCAFPITAGATQDHSESGLVISSGQFVLTSKDEQRVTVQLDENFFAEIVIGEEQVKSVVETRDAAPRQIIYATRNVSTYIHCTGPNRDSKVNTGEWFGTLEYYYDYTGNTAAVTKVTTSNTVNYFPYSNTVFPSTYLGVGHVGVNIYYNGVLSHAFDIYYYPQRDGSFTTSWTFT